MRTSIVQTTIATLGLTLVAGCGDNSSVAPTLRFEGLDDTLKGAVANAATGWTARSAMHDMVQFADAWDDMTIDDDSACPIRTIAYPDVTVAGGCTSSSGFAIGGVATVSGREGWGADGSNARYQFDEFSIDGPYTHVTYDGTIHRNGNTNVLRTLAVQLELRTPAYRTYADLTADCDGRCNVSGGVEVSAIGSAGVLVDGWYDQRWYAEKQGVAISEHWTLRGADTFVIDIDNGCLKSWIVGVEAEPTTCFDPTR